MSAAATWSTQATPLAGVAGAVVFSLGVFCIVTAAIVLALGDTDWNLPAYACLLLAAGLVFLRLRREGRRGALSLSWNSAEAGFRIAGQAGRLGLVRVWQGPGWVTLGLRPQAQPNRVLRLVVWKSAVPAPSWSELALRIQAQQLQGNSHQNKENP